MNIPIATYRIQFHAGFTFDSANEILPYLKELGISHVYASPIFKAKKGSMHGYDVVDPHEIDPELGGREKFNQLIEKAKSLNLAWLQDIVPNHMAFDSENKLLMDVFEKGEASQFYKFFDIDWNHPYANLKGRALTPFLGEFYGTCLDKGEILLGIDEEGFFIKYYDLKFPIFLSSYPKILQGCLDLSQQVNDFPLEAKDRVNQIIGIFEELDKGNDEAVNFAKRPLWQMYTADKGVKNAIDSYLEHMNEGKAESLDTLHNLISEQLFRLSFWKVGNDELNYRRFFTVNSLICLKMEDADVFDYIHTQIFKSIFAIKRQKAVSNCGK